MISCIKISFGLHRGVLIKMYDVANEWIDFGAGKSVYPASSSGFGDILGCHLRAFRINTYGSSGSTASIATLKYVLGRIPVLTERQTL